MDRNETIKRIKSALEKRSGVKWSVTGGRGTAWGWITIDTPPARRTMRYKKITDGAPDLPENYVPYDSGLPGGYMTPRDKEILKSLLNLDDVHIQGVLIPSDNAYYQEYIDRAEGRTPSRIGQPYWD